MTRSRLDLDIATSVADADEFRTAIGDLTDGLPVDTEVVEEDGPGGGWPIVRFTGHDDDLYRVALRYTSGDQRDADFFAEGIVPL